MGKSLENKIQRERVEKIRCTVYETCMGIITAVSNLSKNSSKSNCLLCVNNLEPPTHHRHHHAFPVNCMDSRTPGVKHQVFKLRSLSLICTEPGLLTICTSNFIHLATYTQTGREHLNDMYSGHNSFSFYVLRSR